MYYHCGKKVQKHDQMRVHDWKPRNSKQENNYVQPFFFKIQVWIGWLQLEW
jgi:hypothetical protein